MKHPEADLLAGVIVFDIDKLQLVIKRASDKLRANANAQKAEIERSLAEFKARQESQRKQNERALIDL